MRITRISGRLFSDQDTQNGPPVAIVNQALARRFWLNTDPIGKVITLYPPESLIQPGQLPPGYHIPRISVVGVVADAHYGSLASQVTPLVYAPLVQNDWNGGMAITVRAEHDVGSLVSAVRNAVFDIDKNQPIANVFTMDEVVSASVAQPWLQGVLLGLFGGLAMMLAAIGIYGLISYSVVQRSGEIGIRMALGANRSSVLRMVLLQALSLAGLGILIGLVCAAVFTRVLRSVLFAVKPGDPAIFALIMALLLAVVLVASYVPAWRATRVEPVSALR
jgi:putative ABC transport system permease protein